MIKILDKYLLKKYLTTYFFTVLVIVSVIVVIDYTEKNGDFIKTQAPLDKILFDYFLNFVPYMTHLFSPIMVFISTVFVTANLASHTEIVAILSSGVSYKRFLLPYLAGSIFLAVFIFVLGGWIIPKANIVRRDFENTYVRSKYYFDGHNVHIKIGPETYAYMESYNNVNRVGYQFTLEHIVGQELKKKVKATRINWNEEKNAWHLEQYMIRELRPKGDLISRGAGMDTVISLTPSDFESKHMIHETFTLGELEDYIDLLKLRGADDIPIYLIEKYQRYAYPFAIIILTLIGVILSSRKSRGGVGIQIAFGFFLAFVYILMVIMSTTIAKAGTLHPMLAVWIPNLLFSAIGLVLYRFIPK